MRPGRCGFAATTDGETLEPVLGYVENFWPRALTAETAMTPGAVAGPLSSWDTGVELAVPSARELADDYAVCIGPYSQDPTDKLAVLRATFCQGLETSLGSTINPDAKMDYVGTYV
jgi:hypothetical protein